MPRYPIRARKRLARPGIYRRFVGTGGAVVEVGFTDAAEIYVDLQVTSIEVSEAVDSATVYFDIQPSGLDAYERVDSAEIYFKITPSGVDVISEAPTFITGYTAFPKAILRS